MIPSPLRVRAIRRLVFAYAVNQLGDWAGEMALAIAIFAATGSAAAVAATWVVHRALLALLAPWFVARLEGRPRPRVLIGLYLMQAALFAGLVALTSLGFWAVLPILAVDGMLAPTVRALARTSLVTVAEPRGLLRDANALVNVVFTLNGVLAPVLGGILVAAAGPCVALAADATSFLLAALAVRGVAVPVLPMNEAAASSRLRAALRYAGSQAVIGGLLAGDALYTVFVAAITPIEVAFVCGTLGAPPSALGTVLAAWGTGMVAGGIAAGRLSRVRTPVLLAVAATAPAVACLGMGASTSIGSVLFWSAVGGLGNGAYGMAFLTALQERTAAIHQACVNALYEMVVSMAPGLGFMAGGVVAAVASPRAVYLAAGAGALAVLAVTSARLRGADWSLASRVAADFSGG